MKRTTYIIIGIIAVLCLAFGTLFFISRSGKSSSSSSSDTTTEVASTDAKSSTEAASTTDTSTEASTEAVTSSVEDTSAADDSTAEAVTSAPETTTAAPTTAPATTPETVPTTTGSSGLSPAYKTASSNGYTIAIDAGHQAHSNKDKEPIGPGSSETKIKVSSGTAGVATGVEENALVLTIAQKLSAALQAEGYGIVMIRNSADVDISNAERAQIANESGADICIRLHADGVDNSSVRGASTQTMTSSNPWCSNLYSASKSLSTSVINAYCSATGFNNRGVFERDDLTGTNWSTIPVTLLELGFMSNPDEDRAMEESDMQAKMVQGIVNGIDNYFN